MNLRKLLCGLLALCLLLTMAPAALMEDAPVDEQVVELGGDEVVSEAVDAEDYSIISDPPTTTSEFDIEDNMKVSVLKGKKFTAEAPYGWVIKSVTVKSGAKYLTGLGNDALEVWFTGAAKGTTRLQVIMTDGVDTISCIINVTVTTPDSPENLVICDYGDGTELKKKTLDVEGDYLGLEVTAIATKPSKMVVDIKKWTTSDKKVVAIVPSDDLKTCLLVPLKAGSATVKAYAKNGKVASVKVTVTDKHGPTSVKIKTDDDKKKIGTNAVLDMWVEIKPLEWNAQAAKWKVDKSSVAYVADPSTGKAVDKSKYYDYVVLVPRKAGKVKVTATAYNDKKNSITIEITDAKTVKKFNKVTLEGYTLENGEIMDVELYDEILTTNPKKPVATKLYLEFELLSEAGNVLDPSGIVYSEKTAYTKTKWTSNNKKVATVATTKWADTVAITMKGTGKATITGETANGKKFSFKLNVSNSHGISDLILLKKKVTVYTDDMVDLSPYFMPVFVDDTKEFYGTFSVTPHHTSMVKYVSGTIVETQGKTGNAKVDIKMGDKKVTITLKIKKP